MLPPRTVNQILDNVALRRVIRNLAEQASLADPILATEGTAGFEIVNDIVNSVAGSLASASFRRDQWLLAVTCEDRKVVRKCCIRVLLIRRGDLERMASWDWCREHVLVEEWYHFWRIVTLHQIALRFQEEQAAAEAIAAPGHPGEPPAAGRSPGASPAGPRAVAGHQRRRARSSSRRIAVDWERYLPQIAEMGLKLPGMRRRGAGRLNRGCLAP